MTIAPHVLALVDHDQKSAGCNLWRVWQPFAELQRRGFVAEWGWNQDDRTAMLATRFDAIIMPRLTWGPDQIAMAQRWVDLLHSRGQILISEWDDDAFGDEIVERNIQFEAFTTREEAIQHRDMARFVLQLADGVTVTTQHLQAIAERYTDKPVVVVPNAIDLDWWRDVLATTSPRVVPPPTIGWAGGQRPDRDVEAMAVAWGKIAEQRPEVTFVVIGHLPAAIVEHVPEARIRWLQWLPVEEYPLNYINVDIGCCPLSSEAFNRSKTPIKAMEYTVAGAGVVASPTVYGQLIRNGATGYLATTAEQWQWALLEQLDNAPRRHRLRKNLRNHIAQKHSLRGQWWKWPAAWQEIAEDAHGACERATA